MAETQQQAQLVKPFPEATELPFLSLRQVAELQGTGQLSATVYAQALIDRLSNIEPRVHAFAWLDKDHILRCAELADQARQRTQKAPPLTGVPVAVKDIIDTAGIPTEMGSPVFKNHVPQRSALVVQDLEAQGGYVLGKAHTSEFAFRTPSPTHNPWKLAYTPGGSSGGSAAAVAARIAPVALGSQTNGSVIRPAAYCGIVGFKPTYGLLSCQGVFQLSHTLDHLGAMTRTVGDMKFFLACLAPKSLKSSEPAKPVKRPRLLALKSPVWDKAEDLQKDRFARDVDHLASSACQVEWKELDNSFQDAHKCQRTIVLYEASHDAYKFSDSESRLLSDGLRAFLAEGANVPRATYEEMLAKQKTYQRMFREYIESFDGVVTPAVPGPAPEGLESTGDPMFSTIWTLLGVPAVSVPTGLTSDGRPLAIQLIARAGADQELLEIADLCENVFQFRAVPAC